MNYQEVKTLLDAGFSHDEIVQLSTVSTGNPQETPPETKPDEQDKKPAPVSEQSNPETDAGKPDSMQELRTLIKELKASNNQLIKTIQTSNLQNNSVLTTGEDMNKRVDDIMNSIIRTPKKEGE